MAEPLIDPGEEFSIWQKESMHRKILRQFNTPKSQGGERGEPGQEYPKMLYKAQRHPLGGRFYVFLDKDELSLDGKTVIVDAQAFNRTCQITVDTRELEERVKRDGWRKSMAEAMEYVGDSQEKSAIDAAHQNYLDRGMSEKALKEKEAYELTVPGHVASIPEKPRQRKPMSAETKAKLAASLAKAREAKKAKAAV